MITIFSSVCHFETIFFHRTAVINNEETLCTRRGNVEVVFSEFFFDDAKLIK